MTNAALLADRAVIRLSGEDRHAFLQGLITQDVNRLAPGHAIFAALLTPQGKILFDFFIADTGDMFLIDCFQDAAPALLKRLMLYKLRAKVALEIDDALQVWTSESSDALNHADAFPDPRLSALGWRAIGPAGEDGGDDDYARRRLEFGVPEFGADFGSDEVFLLDINYDALNGVDYKKGCFVGQEVTSRMKRKGEVRRRTLLAAFDGAAPAKGAEIVAGDSTIGTLMSNVDDRALALVRTDRWEKARDAGESLLCDGRELRLHIPGYLEQA